MKIYQTFNPKIKAYVMYAKMASGATHIKQVKKRSPHIPWVDVEIV